MNTGTFRSVKSKWWLIFLFGAPSAHATDISEDITAGSNRHDQIRFWCNAYPIPHQGGRAAIRERAAMGDLITDATTVSVQTIALPNTGCRGPLQSDSNSSNEIYSATSTTPCTSTRLTYYARITKSDTNAEYYSVRIFCVNNGGNVNPLGWDKPVDQ